MTSIFDAMRLSASVERGIFAALVIALFAGCSGAPRSERAASNAGALTAHAGPIPIGVLAVPFDFLDVTPAAQLAVDEINAAGGVLGRPLALVVQNAVSPDFDDLAVQAFQALVAEGAVAILGPLFSFQEFELYTLARDQSIVMLSPSSTNPFVADLKDAGFVWRAVPSDDKQGAALAALARARGLPHVAIVNAADCRYCDVITNQFVAAFADATHTVDVQSYQPDQNNSAAVLAEIGNPPGLLHIAFDPGFIIAAENADLSTQWLFPDAMEESYLTSSLSNRRYLDGALGTTTSGASVGTPLFAKFAASFAAATGSAPAVPFLDATYDATYVLAAAIEIAGTTAGGGIKAAMARLSDGPGADVGAWGTILELAGGGARTLDLRGTSGALNFDPRTGDLAPPWSIVQWTFQDGAIQEVGLITSDSAGNF
jgi:ABC-type branched-subunit amino acid transport system substrate-binding protein